jgi:hypothetical protein
MLQIEAMYQRGVYSSGLYAIPGKRFQWPPHVTAVIDWMAYTQVISRFPTQRIQITKLCNDLLPTARWAHQYDSLTTEHCLYCGNIEDRDHILRCTFAPRHKWRNNLLRLLRKAHDSDSCDHYLLDILISGLDSWFNGLVLTPDRYPRRYHRLIAEQTNIGWRHMFNGHLSLEWRTKQDYYIRRRKIKTLTNTGAGWVIRSWTILWTEFFTLWKARNEAIHGHNQSTQHQARCRKLRMEMELLHSYRNKVLACDTAAFIGDSPS